jgi:NAD+ diphosphatase
MNFIPGFKPTENVDPSAFWFIFKDENLLLNIQGDTFSIPETRDLGECRRHLVRQQFIGSLDNRQCFTADMGDGAPKREDLEAKNLRSIFNAVDDAEITEADWFTPEDLPRIPPRISIARQLIDWFTARNRA